jgi:ADP-ribose pyrophosphatase YjhB (NUDIX family)
MKSKTSYGIALCRRNKENNNVEILLIKKRYSYQYHSFVMAHYKKSDIKNIKYLFDNMSFSEKIDILSMDFSAMWRRIWLNNPEKYFNLIELYRNNVVKNRFSDIEIHKMYHEKKNRFENNFTKDNGAMLRNLIQTSKNAEILWEIPKGRKDMIDCETNIDCAIREFYEETSISSDKYRILYNVDPVVDSFVDNNTIYKTIYYIAINEKNENFVPRIDFRNFEQILEVEQIKWVSITEIKFFNMQSSIHKRLYQLFAKIFKKHNKISSLPIISNASF